MRYISNLLQHPEIRKQRFPEHLWPGDLDNASIDEWWILLEFLEAAGSPAQVAPTKLRPPSPDFQSVFAGNSRLFELGEILDSSLAKGLAHSGKEAQRKMEALSKGDLAAAASIKTAGGRMFSANGALSRMLEKKLTHNYECNGIPGDLVLFYDQQVPYGPFEFILENEVAVAQALRASAFENIWLFHLPEARIIGRLCVHGDGRLGAFFDYEFRFDKRAPFPALRLGEPGEPDRLQVFEPVLTPLRVPKK